MQTISRIVTCCVLSLLAAGPALAGSQSAMRDLAYEAQRQNGRVDHRSGMYAVPVGADGQMVVVIEPGKSKGAIESVRIFERGADRSLHQLAMGNLLPIKPKQRVEITSRVELSTGGGIDRGNPLASLSSSLKLPKPAIQTPDSFAPDAFKGSAVRLRSKQQRKRFRIGQPLLAVTQGGNPDQRQAFPHAKGSGRTLDLGARTRLVLTSKGTPVLYHQGRGYSPGKSWRPGRRRK